MQWEAYLAQTPASDVQEVLQMRATYDMDLLQSVYVCETFLPERTIKACSMYQLNDLNPNYLSLPRSVFISSRLNLSPLNKSNH